jgi:hypothetical protein
MMNGATSGIAFASGKAKVVANLTILLPSPVFRKKKLPTNRFLCSNVSATAREIADSPHPV